MKRKKTDNTERLTFLEHVYELRSRLFWILVTLVGMSALAFQCKDQLVAMVMAPLHGQKLVYLTPGGGFSFIFTLCIYFGALLTIPVAIYHLYRFLQPILGRTSRLLVTSFMGLSTLLAAGGAAFGYFVAIPAALNFLTTFAGDAVMPSLTAESYLSFVVTYMLGLAALFQLPLILFMMDHVRPFPPGALLSSERYVIVGAVIAAAVITPTPDVVNQMIMAGPIIVVYQLGALAVYLRRAKSRRTVKKMPVRDKQTPINIPQVVKTATITLSPVMTTPSPAVRHRSIEGFSRKHRPLPIIVPTRGSVVRPEPVAQSRLRSIDGIMRSPSANGTSVTTVW